MEIRGQVEAIILNAGTENYPKTELILRIETQYATEYVNIEFGGSRSELPHYFVNKLGKIVLVSINLGGRKWINPAGEIKYFNSIKGWKIELQEE